MIATTRSASITPWSMSVPSSLASETLCSGILRTSIGSGTAHSSAVRLAGSVWQVGGDHGARTSGQGVANRRQVGDDGLPATGGEPARRLDLRAHAAAA